jgi:prepilin-type N-terminal cleavage/methylation domain-containing protein
MRRRSGFTLVEIAVVLVIIALISAVLFASLRSVVSSSKFKTTNQALQNADIALVNFVTIMRRLPCPADGSLPSGDPNFGKELPSCPNPADQVNGVVPWSTLGIAQADIIDGFGSLITYRVAAPLVQAESMNFSACDPAGGRVAAAATTSGCACPDPAVGTPSTPPIPTDCTQPNAAYLNKGLTVTGTVQSTPGAAPPTGAAYVLISHGPNLGPSWSGQGTIANPATMNPGIGIIGTNEGVNAVNQPVQPYVDGPLDGSETTNHFDDILLHPSVSNVASRAGLGPRPHNP